MFSVLDDHMSDTDVTDNTPVPKPNCPTVPINQEQVPEQISIETLTKNLKGISTKIPTSLRSLKSDASGTKKGKLSKANFVLPKDVAHQSPNKKTGKKNDRGKDIAYPSPDRKTGNKDLGK